MFLWPYLPWPSLLGAASLSLGTRKKKRLYFQKHYIIFFRVLWNSLWSISVSVANMLGNLGPVSTHGNLIALGQVGWNSCCKNILNICCIKKMKWWYFQTGCCSSCVCRWHQHFKEVFSLSLLENKLFRDINLGAAAIFFKLSSDCSGWEAGYNGTSFHGMKLAGILVSSSAWEQPNHYHD